MDGDVDPGVPEAPNQILYLYYPIRDEELPCTRKLHAVGRLVADLVRARHVALVHCRMGFNRSNLVIATALTYLGMSGEEAVTHLQRVRPGALYNEAFADYLKGLPVGGNPPPAR
jgi:protein-tyrosine phosphatase